ncbi:fumarate reductase/succinate dehydrogenase flavoprotein domain protein [Thermodesulfobacterium geofontis OPF15]|jgi:quinone-modifying oxidoreductase subunit QmoA|uniref:Fumarate reductase/succinate dehydrogenase flavoprotein domain protein n=1 Tax=Thermodesulfobacterium geofontis (strain OPF15) TaxID=795359 RepID=F8C464_THEGP|nr:CoB--CoM heterodisulfide reductase iron-sulfur subunit A family protein [Thermodesulfobacterium geofontis]AEH22290.1 fumarate reductase/succinate dehydrogenase flavoprotein domain protein [Thermodesulfobacterium geofontis OPF15]
MKKPILVVGGGISGITAAVEAAEVGAEVILIEKEPSLGGRVAQLRYYFPKLCPPSCGLEINYRRIKTNPRIKVYTMTEIAEISGEKGNYKVKAVVKPRYVNDNCTACGECEKVCEGERVSEFDFGLRKTKAIYLPHPMAFPMKYVLDKSALAPGDLERIMSACKYNAIDPDMKEETLEFEVGAIIWATGWKPYDATKLDNLGYGKYANVITNMQMERLASPWGPTGGKILRPSDQSFPKRVAFVQCAGSRDENHLPYCSYICCLASLKQSLYLAEQDPEAEALIFYIDIRTPGRYEKFLRRAQNEARINFIKGKVAKIEEDPETKDLIVTAEDILSGKKIHEKVNLVVLALGMQPSIAGINIKGLEVDENGFVISENGIIACGCAKMPLDVMTSNETATGAALKAVQTILRG